MKCGDTHITRATEHPVERRKAIRYRMKTSAIFRWKGSRSDHFQGEGTTRDISIGGVYVLTAACPPVESIIQMDVVFPPLHSASKTRIKAEMRVLRVEHDIAGEGQCGFSAVGKGFALHAISKQSSGSITDSAEKPEEQK